MRRVHQALPLARIALLVAATAALTTAMPAQAQDKPEKSDLTIGVAGSAADVDKLGYAMALNKGFFKDEGLDVTSVDFFSGARALQAIAGGTVEVIAGAYEGTQRMQAQGLTLKCMVTYARYPGVALVSTKGHDFKSIADLKGKTIGITAPGSLTHTFMVALLNQVGLTKNDVGFIAVGVGASAVAAVRTGGQLDALVNVDPGVTSLVMGGDAKIMVDARTSVGSNQAFGGPYPNGCVFASEDFINKNPKTAQAIANAIVRSMKYLQKASMDDIVKAIPRTYYQDEAVYRAAVKVDLDMIRWDGIMTPEIGQTVRTAISLIDDKFKNATIDVSKTYTNEFTLRALAKYK